MLIFTSSGTCWSKSLATQFPNILYFIAMRYFKLQVSSQRRCVFGETATSLQYWKINHIDNFGLLKTPHLGGDWHVSLMEVLVLKAWFHGTVYPSVSIFILNTVICLNRLKDISSVAVRALLWENQRKVISVLWRLVVNMDWCHLCVKNVIRITA